METLLTLSPVLLAAVAAVAAVTRRPVLTALYVTSAVAVTLDTSTIVETFTAFAVVPCTIAPLLWIATDARYEDPLTVPS